MAEEAEQRLPRARHERLVVEELADEILVYDLDRDKAHCLNKTASLIWEHCDGKATFKEMASILEREMKTPVDERAIWYGLDQLAKFRLLDEPVVMPVGMVKLTRRELVRRIGLSVAVPLVMSVLAPTASAALSCVGLDCTGNPLVCGAQCTCDTGVTNKCI